jgi:hypothetical protein
MENLTWIEATRSTTADEAHALGRSSQAAQVAADEDERPNMAAAAALL